MITFPSIDEFKSFLGDLQPTMLVSFEWSCTSCPIAVFLRHVGEIMPKVHPLVWSAGNRGGDLPVWAREFVYWVDQCNPRVINAEECLAIIDSPMFDPKVWGNAGRQLLWSTP